MKPRQSLTALTALALLIAAGQGVWFCAAGCGNASPLAVTFLTNQAAANIQGGSNGGGGGGGGGTPGGSVDDLCDLDTDEQTLQIEVRNESRAEVDFAVVLITTAGTGGFVCLNMRDTFIDFGYEVEQLVNGGKTFGCETVTLDRGTELLAFRVDGTVPAVEDDEPFTTAPPPFDGSTDIPLPTVIILGDDEPASSFDCTSTSDPCTQGGFIYIAGNITLIPASRTQGTLCNTRVSPRPRWILRDPAALDRLARDFEYVKGGRILITILDRAANTDATVNQVVWQVDDKDGNVVTEELR